MKNKKDDTNMLVKYEAYEYQNLKGSPDKILNIGNKKDFEKIGSKKMLWEQNFKVYKNLWPSKTIRSEKI